MKTFAYALNLQNDSESISNYKEHHKNVWPEVLRSIRGNGVIDNKIFLLGNHLFMMILAEDSYNPADLQNYATDEKCKQWDSLMRTLQQPLDEARPGELWAEMECVFDMEEQLKRVLGEKQDG